MCPKSEVFRVELGREWLVIKWNFRRFVPCGLKAGKVGEALVCELAFVSYCISAAYYSSVSGRLFLFEIGNHGAKKWERMEL